MNHFYFGSSIDSINVSGKTVKEAKREITSDLKSYALNLKERGDKIEQIKATDIGLKYYSDGQVSTLKNNQKPFAWVLGLTNAKETRMNEKVSFREELLKKQLNGLSCLNSDNIVEPKNPSFKYANGEYKIVAAVNGNKINEDVLYDEVAKAIRKGQKTIDLESINCYINPQYASNSQKVIDTQKMLNRYVSSKITYSFGSSKEVIDDSKINKWLSVDEDYNVSINEDRIKAYLNSLANTYDTVGKTRNFVTTSGNAIKVSGGDYGLLINISKEEEKLTGNIKDGKSIVRDPVYSQTALTNRSNDIGSTYVEIDLAKQHLWFYKNGSLVAQGDVVTGNVAKNDATPSGVYSVKYKQRDATLKGQGYSAPVSFWMPFNGGIGMHDASWRSVFGGTIYETNGSHGCVNCPYTLAKTLFYNIQAGCPVVCYK